MTKCDHQTLIISALVLSLNLTYELLTHELLSSLNLNRMVGHVAVCSAARPAILASGDVILGSACWVTAPLVRHGQELQGQARHILP